MNPALNFVNKNSTGNPYLRQYFVLAIPLSRRAFFARAVDGSRINA